MSKTIIVYIALFILYSCSPSPRYNSDSIKNEKQNLSTGKKNKIKFNKKKTVYKGVSSYYGPNLIDLKPFQPLLSTIKHTVQKEMNTVISVQNAWFTIYEQDQFIVRHSHPITEWSGVYYYKVEENCGDLVFYDPIGSFRNHFTGNYPFKYTVKPTNGLLLAFPAWLEHESLPNKSGSDRIIFSYNFFARDAI